MRAGELLTVLTLKIDQKTYTGVYFQAENRQIPFTHMTINNDGFLILYHEEKAAKLSMKDFLKILMLNKKRPLYFWDGHKLSLVFGCKEEKDRLIL